ncbi:MAG: elongator complex protein 3 [Thermodesulfobacteriota bacterium]
MTPEIRFSQLEPIRDRTRIWPVFLPFQGCPNRCLYCAQDAQTGAPAESLGQSFDRLEAGFRQAHSHGTPPFELGFYGGTFTRLPRDWTAKFIGLAARYRRLGLITRIRCSTRPDGLDRAGLSALKEEGLDLVELGVQSLSDRVLTLSMRSYSREEAEKGCRIVRESGLDLGIQLLPGLPGHKPRTWLRDIDRVIKLQPALVRIYPCLVVKGTGLEKQWQKGGYVPWSLEQTVASLGRGVFRLWRAGIPVTRIGLPPESGLVSNLAAGPWHPALGSLVKSRILLARLVFQALALGPGAKEVICPRRFQGEFFGHQGRHRARLARVGIPPGAVTFWDQDHFVIRKKTRTAQKTDV